MDSVVTWGLNSEEWTALSAIGTICAALLTFFAVCLSLYLARSDRPRLSIALEVMVRTGMPEDGDSTHDRKYVQVILTNKGKVPLNILGFFWQIGIWPWKKVVIIPPIPFSLNQKELPHVLSYGEQIVIYLPMHRLEALAITTSLGLSNIPSYKHCGVPLRLRFGVYTTIKSFTSKPGERMAGLLQKCFAEVLKMSEN